MRFHSFLIAIACVLFLGGSSVVAQPKGFNYDESKVPKFELPDSLIFDDGSPVKSVADWKKRRAEVLQLFRDHVYGNAPKLRGGLKVKLLSEEEALDGLAIRKQVRIQLTDKPYGPRFDLLIYRPAAAKKAVPAILGYNFYGNHTIHPDPGIVIHQSWSRNDKSKGVVNNRATEAGRGSRQSRWAVEMILRRGYALATIYYGDVEPDHKDGWEDSTRSYYLAPGRSKPAPTDWGAIGAWATGLSRALDYLGTDRSINEKQVVVFGHSRLGKTSLWTGASDERFAITISNNSGCGGAALSRRRFGETVKRINTVFPHWFNDRFNRYNENENDCPVDQHMLVALMAPRPVYIASAEEDRWADPNGEFLSGKHADPVYALFDKVGVGVDKQPGLDQPVGDTIGYHVRTGGHDVKDYDWEQYLNFADRHFGRTPKEPGSTKMKPVKK